MRFKRLSGKNARARVGRCETEQPVFSARLPRAARRGRAKRPTALKNSKRAAAEIQVRSSPFSCTLQPKLPGECASNAFQGKTPAPEPADAKQSSRFSAPVTACGERSGPQRRQKREKSRRGKSKAAAAPFPAPHGRNRRTNALQAPFREKRPRQSRQMRNRAAGFQRPFTACGAAERSGLSNSSTSRPIQPAF